MLFRKNNDIDDDYLPDPELTVLPEISIASLPDKVSIDLSVDGVTGTAPEFPVLDSDEPLMVTGGDGEAIVTEDTPVPVFDEDVFNFTVDPDSLAAVNAYNEEPSEPKAECVPEGISDDLPVVRKSERAERTAQTEQTEQTTQTTQTEQAENEHSETKDAAREEKAPSVTAKKDRRSGRKKKLRPAKAKSEDNGDATADNDNDGSCDTPAEPEGAESVDEGAQDGLNDFEASLMNFKAEDTDSAVETKKKGFDIVRLLVIAICLGAFTISTYTLITNITDKIKSDRIYSDIIDSVADGFNVDGELLTNGGKITLLAQDNKTAFTPTMDEMIKNGVGEVTTPSKYTAELAKMRASLESLRNINPDIYGWIKVPGTNINYPIAQTDNNEYYLDHAYTGDNLVNGSIYADYRCSPSVSRNYNTVLYGHNITSGSMFHHVVEFFKPEVFNNTLIYLYTFEGIYIYEPFSIHEASYDSGYIDMGFDTGDDFVKFASDLASLSEVKTDRSFTADDRLITLSTCTNGISTQRYALHGVLVEIIKE